jgi:polyisoprenoid-binding protein YceI
MIALAASAGAGLAALSLAASAGSQAMKLPTPAHSYKAAPAGTYKLDAKHMGLVARVPHFGFSYSVFRFTDAKGDLTWDPANPKADKLDVTVDPKAIETANTGGDFAGEIGTRFLKVAQFPTATFTSTAFHATGPDHGTVDGDLTLMGVTKHVVFDVKLVGAGKGMHGNTIGVTARTELDPTAYNLPGVITGPIELTIDSEFDG